MSECDEGQRRLFEYRWNAFKERYGIAGFVDEDGHPVDEGALTNSQKQDLMDAFAGNVPGEEDSGEEKDAAGK